MGQIDTRESLLDEIKALEDELKEREKALPAHTIRPHQLQAIEELEEKIRTLQDRLRTLPHNSPESQ